MEAPKRAPVTVESSALPPPPMQPQILNEAQTAPAALTERLEHHYCKHPVLLRAHAVLLPNALLRVPQADKICPVQVNGRPALLVKAVLLKSLATEGVCREPAP